jgi:hypothetical protein
LASNVWHWLATTGTKTSKPSVFAGFFSFLLSAFLILVWQRQALPGTGKQKYFMVFLMVSSDLIP